MVRVRGWCVVALAMVALSTAREVSAGELTGRLQGDALVRAPGKEDLVTARDGAPLMSGTLVQAPSDHAATLALSDDVRVRLAPGASITLLRMASLPAENPGAHPIPAFQLTLAGGEIDVDVRSEKAPVGVVVQLSGGRSLGLWRGSANLALMGGDKAAIAVYGGMAIVGSASGWKSLTGGAGAVLTGNTVTTRPIPASPRWSEGPDDPPASLDLVRGDTTVTRKTTWSAAVGAASYRFEIDRDARMPSARCIEATGLAAETPPLTTGETFARVRAVSADGIVGPPSAPRAMRVARITVPSVAMDGRDGSIVLPASAAVTLDDPRGLEVATVSDYDPFGGALWSAAPKTVSLAGAGRRVVRIRGVGSTDEKHIVLRKRELRARVDIGPKRARWPEDAVDVVVKVEDPSGMIDPSRETVAIDVRIDLDAANVTWNHTGDTWTGRVPAHVAPGPWVVRVRVNDRDGNPLGASFLEVDGPRVATTSERAEEKTAVRVIH